MMAMAVAPICQQQPKALKIDNGATAGSATHNGVNTITFTPFASFAKGIHTIEITPVDVAGNKSQAITFQFGYFDKTSDIIQVTTDPIDKSLKNALAELKIVSATLSDLSDKGIDFDTSTIRLKVRWLSDRRHSKQRYHQEYDNMGI